MHQSNSFRRAEHITSWRPPPVPLARDFTTDPAIVMEHCTEAVAVKESVTVTVKVNVPPEVGVPLAIPVTGSRISPEGSAPAVIENEYGGFPDPARKV